MKRLFFILFILSVFFSSAAWAAKASHTMKLVFPFGDGTHNSSVCDINYRTLDGCCEPPHALYTHDQRIGCCKTPNIPLTVGANTRCCASAAANQTRWGQTETSPCGQFCTQPNSVLAGFGKSSCCAGCTGDRWNQNAGNICGDCCNGTSSVSYVGAYSSCCGALPAGQNRWGQTTSSVCGGYCPPASSIFTYETLNSCCSSCGEVIAFQSAGNVCGTCCSRVPESCGNAGVRVCEPGTGSAYCSSDVAKCTPPTDWIIGTSGEGGYTCCAACTGVRYNHTESSCGACCPTGDDILTVETENLCCPTCAGTRYNLTTSSCGGCCPTGDDILTVGTENLCCPTCTGTRYNLTASSCGGCCAATSQTVTYSNLTDCCTQQAANQTRWNQTTANICGAFCTQPSSVVTYNTSSSCCAALPANNVRFSQTAANICGTPLSCGAGAVPNVAGNACVCDTASGFSGTWKKDTGSGNGCNLTVCNANLLAAGYKAADFKISGDTIIYTGNMIVSQNLDLGKCHLVVNASSGHALYVQSGKTLKAKSIDATTSGTGTVYGIYSYGTINAETITGTATGTGGFGILNDGPMTATISITGTGGHTGIFNGKPAGRLTAPAATGTGGHTGIGSTREAAVYVTTITGVGGTYGINNDGPFQATTIYYCPSVVGQKATTGTKIKKCS